MLYEIKDEQAHTPRITRKRQQRMQQILRAAFAIAREEGRDALTLQRLADRLDYTPGALYRYFASKDALVAELQRSVLAWLGEVTAREIDAAEQALGEAPVTGRPLLPVVVTALVFEHLSRSAPVEFGLLSMHLSAPEYGLPETEAALVFGAAWARLDELAERIDDAVERGALARGDAHERAIALWAGLQGVAQTRKLARNAPGEIDATAIAHGLIRSLLVGWGAEPEPVHSILTTALERGFAAPQGSVDDVLDDAA